MTVPVADSGPEHDWADWVDRNCRSCRHCLEHGPAEPCMVERNIVEGRLEFIRERAGELVGWSVDEPAPPRVCKMRDPI